MHIVADQAPTRDAGPAVKPWLTRQPHRENGKFVAFCRRIIRAYARRIGDGDIEALRDLVNMRADVDAAIDKAIAGLRDFGYSWAEIGARLGVTKQAAQQRWARSVDIARAADREERRTA